MEFLAEEDFTHVELHPVMEYLDQILQVVILHMHIMHLTFQIWKRRRIFRSW